MNGGIAVPPVLGSASTHLLTGIGGFGAGRLSGATCWRWAPARRTSTRRRPVTGFEQPSTPAIIHVTAPASAQTLCAATWEVKADSDRMGLRLRGPALTRHTGHMLTEGVPLGAIQVPPDGQPIVLFVEHQTTGGYPRIANVISADFHALGQLRPGERYVSSRSR